MRIWFKLAMALGLSLAFVIPLAMVSNLVSERAHYRAQAVRDVARSYAGPQAVAGPVLTVPYTDNVAVNELGTDGVVRRVQRRHTAYWTYFPGTLRVSGALVPDTRKRGIYEVHVYTWHGALQSDFDVTLPDDAPADAQREIGQPYLSYAISDVRGLRGTPRLTVDGHSVELHEGHGARRLAGVHARLAAPAAGARLTLRAQMAMDLAGAESLSIVPLGKRNVVSLGSTWQHPGFFGKSPLDSSISAKGFNAHWDIASVATDAQREYLDGRTAQPLTATNELPGGAMDALSVALGDPVDGYTLADRATKYGMLFVLLTFVGFFMFELIRALPIHPIQYMLVGLAIAIFFLLLVSLSEHVAFARAYLAASVACIGLITFYLSAVLRSALRGAGFGGMLALLYGALYGLLISEDNALVLGAGLLFVILAAVMVATGRSGRRP